MGIQPCLSGLQVQGTASSPPSTAGLSLPEIGGGRRPSAGPVQRWGFVANDVPIDQRAEDDCHDRRDDPAPTEADQSTGYEPNSEKCRNHGADRDADTTKMLQRTTSSEEM